MRMNRYGPMKLDKNMYRKKNPLHLVTVTPPKPTKNYHLQDLVGKGGRGWGRGRGERGGGEGRGRRRKKEREEPGEQKKKKKKKKEKKGKAAQSSNPRM